MATVTFHTARYKNFLSAGSTFIEIPLDQFQLSLFVGKNGAGKSTLLDVLCFTLYGRPFRNIKKHQLLNSINKKGLVSEVEFSIGDKRYLVRRGLKPNIFEIYADDILLDQTAESGDYQDDLDEILKIGYKSFKQVVVLGSARYTPFMELKSTDRREIIEDLVGLNIFSIMNALLSAEIKANNEKLKDLQYAFKLCKEKVRIHEQHLKNTLEANQTVLDGKRAALAEVQSRVSATHEVVAALNAEIQTLLDDLPDSEGIEGKLNELSKIRARLDQKLRHLTDQVKFFSENETCPTCEQEIVEGVRLDKTETCNVQIAKIDDDAAVADNIEAKLQKKLASIREKNAEIKKIKKQVDQHTMSALADKTLADSLIGDISTLTDQMKNTKTIDSGEIKKLETEYLSTRDELAVEKKQKELLQYAAVLLKDSGIKTKILRKYIPWMNKQINHYLSLMDFYVSFELDENFNETIKSRHRDNFSYNSFSEGQKSRIDLALLFAWRAVARMRTNMNTNLLILDEVFDGSIDNEGGEDLHKILYDLSDNSNIIIISHKDQMIDKFENVYKFSLVKNYSKVE